MQSLHEACCRRNTQQAISCLGTGPGCPVFFTLVFYPEPPGLCLNAQSSLLSSPTYSSSCTHINVHTLQFEARLRTRLALPPFRNGQG